MRVHPLTTRAGQLASLLRAGGSHAAIDHGLLDSAVEHGVAPLLYRALHERGVLEQLDSAIGARLARLAREAALYDEIQRSDLRKLVRALSAEQLHPILFKGAALASSHYAEAWLRPRGDADLLLSEAEAQRAGAILEARGFLRLARPEGPHVTQARYQARVGGIGLAYDVHWRLAEPRVFAECLSYEELAAASVEGEYGRHPCDVHALLIVCMHRVAHHHDADQLIQICDIDRLARGLDDAEWREAAVLAIERGLAAVCLRGLTLAAEAFDTPVPATIREALSTAAAGEAGARFLDRRLRRIDVLASDFGVLDTWRSRLDLVRRHLFPPAAYMRSVHGESVPLPVLYISRIVRGATRWAEPIRKFEVRSEK